MAAVARMVEQGEIIPCLNAERGHLWISEAPEDQTAAAYGCLSCPALDPCRAYVTAHPEPAGVWAGRVRRQREVDE